MALLDDKKIIIRQNGTAADSEITELIDAAKADLILSGIIESKANSETDPLIKRAVSLYCKANFGYDNPEAERFRKCYDMLKDHLALSSDYNTEVVV